MAIEVDCSCGKSLRLREELAGKKVKCPGCGRAVLVALESEEVVEEVPRQKKRGGDDEERRSSRKKKPRPASKVSPLVWVGAGLGGAAVIGVVVFLVLSRGGDRLADKLAGGPPKGPPEMVPPLPKDGPLPPVVPFPKDGPFPMPVKGDPPAPPPMPVDKSMDFLSPTMGKYYEKPGIVLYVLPAHKAWWDKVAVGERVQVIGRIFGMHGKWLRTNQARPNDGGERGLDAAVLTREFEADEKAATEKYRKVHIPIEGTVVGWSPTHNSIFLAGH